MIFMRLINGQSVIIIEPGNIDRLKSGLPLYSPDGGTMLAFSPDMLWTMDQIQAMVAINDGRLDPETLAFILKEGMERPEVVR